MTTSIPKTIEDKRVRVEIETVFGRTLKSRWYATKEEAEDWAWRWEAKSAQYFEESIVGYNEFEKFGKVFRSPVWGK